MPKRQLYINTGNPAAHVARPSKKYPVTGWPTGTEDVGDPGALNGGYGDCDLAVDSTSRACVWLYGYLRARDSVTHFQVTTGEIASGYNWWLDIETSNSWLELKEDKDAYAKNVAAIEGFAAGIKSHGESTYVGVYSNSYESAKTTCEQYSNYTGLKPGGLVLTQFVSGGLDHDYSCVDPEAA